MLFLDGIYVEDKKYGLAVRFQWIKSPISEELARLTHTIGQYICRFLEQQISPNITTRDLSARCDLIGPERSGSQSR